MTSRSKQFVAVINDIYNNIPENNSNKIIK